MANHNKAYVSLDTMFAIIPVLLIVAYTLNSMTVAKTNYENSVEKQNAFDKLVSAADSLVEYGLAKKDNEKYYQNWIMEIDNEVVKKTTSNSGLSGLMISLDEPSMQNTTCIYRLVVYGADKQIKKIYFCGE